MCVCVGVYQDKDCLKFKAMANVYNDLYKEPPKCIVK